MIRMIREVIGMFGKQKVYLFLLIAIVLFYFVFFMVHKKTKADEIVDPQKQRIEMILKEAPQTPEEIQHRLTSRPVLRSTVQLFTLFFLSAFIYGIWLGTIDLKKLFQKEELIPHRSNRHAISWGASEIAKVLILFISLGIFLNLIVIFFKSLLGVPIDMSSYLLIHTVILDIAVILMVIFFIGKSGVRIWEVSGIRSLRFISEELWWGIRTYFLILPLFIGLLIGLIYVASLFSYEPPPHPLVEILLENEKLSVWTILGSFLVACVAGPIVEEIFFRGFFYPAVKKYLGVGWTMVLTSALFAVAHENFFAFLPIFFLGLVLCYLYERRNNLVPCITLHVIHNTAFIVYFFIMKNVLFSIQGP